MRKSLSTPRGRSLQHFSKILLLPILLFLWGNVWGQTITIGSGTNVGSKLPVVPWYSYSFSEQIIPKAEINTAGSITKLRFYSNATALNNSNNWTIYLGHTSKSSFSSGADWILAGAMTQVFSGTVTPPSSAGWMEITLTTPFNYNNTNNLVVAVDENQLGSRGSSSDTYFRIFTPTAPSATTNSGLYYQNDTTNPDPASISLTGTLVNYRNQMQLVIESTSPFVTAGTLTAFGNVCINTTTAANSFTLTGGNLTGDVTVGALAGYTYSTTSGGTYTSTLTLTPTSGSLSQTVFVKFNPILVQSYAGNIPITGGGIASIVNVAASGSGINTTPTLSSNGTAGSIISNGATITGSNISALGCSTVTGYGIEYSLTSGFTGGTGAQVAGTGFSGSAGGTFSTTLSGLNPSTTYYYRAYATNAGGTTYYSTVSNFTTACAIANLPLIQGFNAATIPTCWSQQNVSGSLAITFPTSGSNPTVSAPFEGTNMVYYNSYNNTSATRLVSLPLTSTGVASVDVQFQWYHSALGGATSYLTEGVTVQYSTNGTTWIDAGPQILRYNATTGWSLKKLTLPAGAGNQPILYVGFLLRGNTGYNIYIDAVDIRSTPTDAVDYANIQYPGVSTTTTGTAVEIYGQTYEPGVTPGAGAGAGLQVWYSKNATDVDPSSAAWTGSWISATYHGESGNNDEWKGSITPISGQADTYYSFRYQLNGGPMKYGGYSASGGGFWDGTTNKNGKLSVNYEVYTTAVTPNNTVNNSIDVYFKDYVPGSDFYTSGQAEIWMYAGARVGATTFNHTGAQNFGDRATLVKFVQQTDPTIYKATIKFADVLCVNNTTDIITGIDLNFQNQYYTSGGVGSNNQTENLFLDLGDATVSVSAPTVAPATTVTTTTATINWTAPATGAIKGYDYYYSTTNTAPSAGTTPSGAVVGNVLTANLSALSAGTTYYFWVRTKGCGAAVSAWSSRETFTTSCVVTPIAIAEGFNSATIPNCWKVQFPSSTRISFVASGTNPTTSTQEGDHMVRFNSFNTSEDERLSSMPLSSLGNTSVDVEFYFNRDNGYSTTATTEGVQVQYSLDGTSWVNAGSFIPRYSATVSGWEKQVVTIPSALANSSNFFIGFNFLGSNGNNMFLDTVKIQPTPDPITITSSVTLPICSGSSTTLTASSATAYSYTWSPATGLSSTTGASVVASPTATTTYTVTGNSGLVTTTQNITVTVNPAPTDIILTSTLSPVGADACVLDYVKLDVSGSLAIPIVNEGFENGNTKFDLFASPLANSNFTIISSNSSEGTKSIRLNYSGSANGYMDMELSSPIDLTNAANATLTFDHIAAMEGLDYDYGNLYYSIDGTNFNLMPMSFYSGVGSTDINYIQFDMDSYPNWSSFTNSSIPNNSMWKSEVIDLSSLAGNSQVYIGFEMSHDNSGNYYGWLIDNVKVNVTPKITWTPVTGLYTDATLTIPYVASTNATTVYAAPSIATTYEAKSTLGTCEKTATSASIQRLKHEFRGTVDNLWSNNGNWFPTMVPDADKCVSVPATKSVVININNAEAKSLTIAETGKVNINANSSLKVTDAINITNNVNNDNLVLESDATLLQTNPVSNAGKILVKRDTHMRKMDYTYWGTPVTGQNLLNTSGGANATLHNLGGFSEGTPNSRIYEYNEPNDKFKAATDAKFIPAKAYAIRGKDRYLVDYPSNVPVADQFTFTGIANNGTYSVGIQKSKNTFIGTTEYTHGYNMIGNPYPSNIDFIKFFNLDHGDGKKNSDHILGKAWFWTNVPGAPTSQGGSAYTPNNYAILSLAGGVPATGVDGNETESPTLDIPNEFIKVAQGFIVEMKGTAPTGTTPNTAILKFDNSIRTNNNTGYFYNSKNSQSGINRYWLKLTSPFNIVNTILVAHMDGATNNYDADYDADLLSIGDDSFYSKLNTQKLQIQARNNPLNLEDIIPLGTKYSTTGTYKISLGKSEGVFSSNQQIYLVDKINNTYTDLTAQDYTFTANKGIDDARFEIVYKNKEVLGNDAFAKSDFVVYKDGNHFVVKSSKNLGRVELYDISGRLVQSNKTSDKEIRLDAALIPSGVYIIKAENSGITRTKKIIK
ncbi:T9SS type A sorting domain-containing protein [Epilithonimonas xixisoli]|uniref:Putative secreted protein (Por secretion system target) n=1 Tax=Epilithonimonas xixisoli TaxID=1476462 RepID=A0A4V6QBQ1_9FLAO|nr:T9SS type A sorting domain-containing protein [Epilithonimonas xixisoli]TDX83007.1 putative secreted protein (Por secretion system target) [Epilithonimonas xixisoli]